MKKTNKQFLKPKDNNFIAPKLSDEQIDFNFWQTVNT